MIALGDHAEFILAAYIGIVLGLLLLTGWTALSARRVARRLEQLGEAGRPDTEAR